jgi:hypothetical protein
MPSSEESPSDFYKARAAVTLPTHPSWRSLAVSTRTKAATCWFVVPQNSVVRLPRFAAVLANSVCTGMEVLPKSYRDPPLPNFLRGHLRLVKAPRAGSLPPPPPPPRLCRRCGRPLAPQARPHHTRAQQARPHHTRPWSGKGWKQTWIHG